MNTLLDTIGKDAWFNFLSQLITSTVGAAIGAFITWLVFLLTLENNLEAEKRKLKQDKDAEEEKEAKLEKNKLIYLSGALNAVVEAVEYQIASIQLAVTNLEEESFLFPMINIVQNYSLDEIIGRSKYEDYYHAFRNVNANESILPEQVANEFHRMFSSLAYFHVANPTIQKKHQEGAEIVHKYLERYTECLTECTLLIAEMRHELNTYGRTELLIEFDYITSSWLHAGKIDFLKYNVDNIYFQPLVALLEKEYYASDTAKNLIKTIIKKKHNLDIIRTQREHLVKFFSNYENGYIGSLEILKASAAILDEYGFKHHD